MGEKKPDLFDMAVTVLSRMAWSLVVSLSDVTYIMWMFASEPREAIMVAMMIHLPSMHSTHLVIAAVNKKQLPGQETSLGDLSLVDTTIASIMVRVVFYTVATAVGIALGWFFGVTW